MPLNRLPSSTPTTTRLRKPMGTGPTHSLESLMDNMPDNSKKATKLSAKIQKKQAAARTKSIKKLGA